MRNARPARTFGAHARRRLNKSFSVPDKRWSDRLEGGIDDLRSTLEWCLQQPAHVRDAIAIAFCLIRFWYETGRYAEAFRIFYRALQLLASTDTQQVQAQAQLGAGLMANHLRQACGGATAARFSAERFFWRATMSTMPRGR